MIDPVQRRDRERARAFLSKLKTSAYRGAARGRETVRQLGGDSHAIAESHESVIGASRRKKDGCVLSLTVSPTAGSTRLSTWAGDPIGELDEIVSTLVKVGPDPVAKVIAFYEALYDAHGLEASVADASCRLEAARAGLPIALPRSGT